MLPLKQPCSRSPFAGSPLAGGLFAGGLFARGLFAGGLALALAGCSSGSVKEGDGAQDSDLGGVIFGEGAEQGGPRRGFNGGVCAGESAGAEIAPAVLQLVVDTSGSMDDDAPGARSSKWDVTRNAVLAAIDGM